MVVCEFLSYLCGVELTICLNIGGYCDLIDFSRTFMFLCVKIIEILYLWYVLSLLQAGLLVLTRDVSLTLEVIVSPYLSRFSLRREGECLSVIYLRKVRARF